MALLPEFTRGIQAALGTQQGARIERMQDILALRRETPEVVKMNAEAEPLLNHSDTRRILYKLWWAYYKNNIYKSIDEGGYRKFINDRLGPDAKVGGLTGLYNPVERAADTYQYVFDGRFGNEIKIDPKLDDDKTPVNKKILEPIEQIWKWSNMTEEVELLDRYTPVLGSCGLRVVMENNPAVNNRRVYLSVEHPNVIRDVETDARGNITQLVIEYDRLEGSMREEDPQEWHSYVEYMSKDVFWMQRDGDWWNMNTNSAVDTREEAEVTNLAGFVPYVIVRHRNVGSTFGVPCFYGQEEKIDHINALATHLAHQVHRHVTATWLLEAGGPPPNFVELGDMNIVYIQRELGQTNAARLEAMVANLNLEQAGGLIDRLQTQLSNSMPELTATDGEFLSHQSGGTVAHLRTPAEQRLTKGRASYESAVVKAQKMALSLGIIYGLWDVGTGMGSRRAADEAFDTGKLDHRFNKRALFPLTTDEKLSMAKAEQAQAAARNPNVPAPKGGNNNNQPSSQSPSNVPVSTVGTVGSSTSN